MIDMTELRRSAQAELEHRATARDTQLLHDHLDEWYLALLELIETVSQQNRDREASLEANRMALSSDLPEDEARMMYENEHAEFLVWRSKAMGFKRHVQSRLGQVKLERNRARDERYASRLNAQFYALTQAVERHEEEVVGSGREPNEVDRSLWAAARMCARELSFA